MNEPPYAYRKALCRSCGHEHLTLSGAWLRFVRTRARLSLAALGKRAKVSAQHLFNIERETRSASPELRDRILKGLGL